MDQAIVSSKKNHSPVTLHQHHEIVSIEKVLIKCQISSPNLKLTKAKWDGAEVSTINNFYIIDYIFKSVIK